MTGAAAGPIFLTGLDRSGKTALRRILSAHPRLWLTRRSRLWTSQLGRCGDLADDAALDRCLARLGASEGPAQLLGDVAALRREFREGERTEVRLFRLIHERHARANGRWRWGDQDAEVERHADRLMAILPDARIIHLVRDPLSRYAAIAAGEPASPGRVGDETVAWIGSSLRALRNRRRHAGRYLVLRAEDLAADRSRVVRGVCRFIGEAYSREMEAVVTSDLTDLRSHPASVHDAALVGELAWAPMLRLGYALPQPRLGPAGMARHLAWHRPIALARAARRLAAELPGSER